MKAQSILELRIAIEFAIAKSLTETSNKTEKGVYGVAATVMGFEYHPSFTC